jgi:zinc protease
MRVYNTYIKNKPFVAASFVPKGQTNLILTGSTKAAIVEEKIIEGKEDQLTPALQLHMQNPSSFDRSVEPQYGESPMSYCQSMETKLPSGLNLIGIENYEVPLVEFQLQIKGGLLLEEVSKIGVSNILAELLTKGTKNKTAEELENAIESLGATISATADAESITIAGSTLLKLQSNHKTGRRDSLEPRWDKKEFDLLKQSRLNQVLHKRGSNSIARIEFRKLIYGKDAILSHNPIGDETTINAITLEDLRTIITVIFTISG